jgi:hypothetical protein
MTSLRAVDKDQSVKTLPMRVLCLGASRTGTSSLCSALDTLGYKTYHMEENIKNPRRFFPLWIEALSAKFKNKGRPFGKAEFDKIFADYDACSDLPTALFADELIDIYKDAKVVLSVRDPDKWIQSMQQTIYLAHSWSSWDWLKYWDAGFVTLWRKCDLMDWDAWLGENGRRDFLSEEYGNLSKQRLVEHQLHVQKVTPADRLLVWKPQDGWKPLCDFLGHDIPSEEFPHARDTEAFGKMAAIVWWLVLGKAIVTTIAPFGLAAGAWYWLNSRK